MNVEEQHKEFEEWLRRVCFQKPTPEAYDLAWQAWHTAQQSVERTISKRDPISRDWDTPEEDNAWRNL